MNDLTSKETIATLLNDPDRVKFRELLKNHTGESDELEFKENYPEDPRLAKHIIAMANTGGGLIIFGVEEKDNKFTPIGLTLRDPTDIRNKLSHYLPHELKYRIDDFTYDDEVEWDKIKNKNFQTIIVEPNLEHIPFLSKKEGKDLKQNIVYCRRNSSSDIATYEDLQEILDKRINYSMEYEKTNLKIDLEQLETLYYYRNPFKIPWYKIYNPLFLTELNKLITEKKKIIKEKMK